MLLKFASLGSGSSGNATLIDYDDCLLMVDCGFSAKETERRMLRLGCDPKNLSAILVTHEHSDHIKGVGPLSRKYNIPVYMTEGTFASRSYGVLENLKVIRNYLAFSIGGLHVRPIPVPHDAQEPSQFVFESNGLKLGILTDLGSITTHVIEAYQGCDGLLVEANHDIAMLANGPYPPSLKSRVSGAWGHLNNQQTIELLSYLDVHTIQQLVIGHISRKNNSLAQVKSDMQVLNGHISNIHFACQDEGFDWIELKLRV
ncbi:MAG: phosphoribosyl 1,2-cyclic phosphodiesterase [Lentisphaeria bacterium]